MTPFALAVVGLRLILVFLLLDFLHEQLTHIQFVMQSMNNPTWRDWLATYSGMVLVALLVFIAFWILTRRAARILVRGVDAPGEAFSLPAHQLLVVLLAVIGTYTLLWTLPVAVLSTFHLVTLSDEYREAAGITGIYDIWARTIRTASISILAMVLILNAHRIGAWISSLQGKKVSRVRS